MNKPTALLISTTLLGLPTLLWANIKAEDIRATINATGGIVLKSTDANIHAQTALKQFYLQREFRPAWAKGNVRSNIQPMLTAIDQASQQGLEPDDYHRQALNRAVSNNDAMAIELLATDAYLTLAAHIIGGRLNPETFEPDWTAAKREKDLVKHLQTALDKNAVTNSLKELEPDAPAYQILKQVLASYQQASRSGGWDPIPAGKSIKPGESDPRVVLLRKRLRATGLLTDDAVTAAEQYDQQLEAAVLAFQKRSGLDADGVVGNLTLRNLNVSSQERINQIRANMERWRWLPENLGERHIRVNIADYRLEAREKGKVERIHDIIVGRTYRKTPVFSDHIAYIVFNPWWETPPRLARQDKLPLFRNNPETVKELGFEVLDKSGKPVSPDTINWAAYDTSNFPYRLRQRPGPLNALGQVKIMFPNKHNVYLHDTPSRELFLKSERAFSSGCVRVADTLALAEWLLKDTPGWSRERINNVTNSGKEARVNLNQKVPVHILYFTTVTEPDQSIRFVNDIYDRDQRLISALTRP